jgi:rhodanese-related sulfurtransferase
MKSKNLLIIMLVILVLSLAGCTSKDKTSSAIIEKITSTKAKDMMDQNESIIVLDVRTEEEYNTGHIQGAILIPDDEIEEKVEDIIKDKAATILVYCRSGRRSEAASIILNELGYTNIYDFGGIIDWEYEIVTN